jgi:hypothetical protein
MKYLILPVILLVLSPTFCVAQSCKKTLDVKAYPINPLIYLGQKAQVDVLVLGKVNGEVRFQDQLVPLKNGVASISFLPSWDDPLDTRSTALHDSLERTSQYFKKYSGEVHFKYKARLSLLKVVDS